MAADAPQEAPDRATGPAAVGMNYLLMLLSPFTLHATGVAAAVVALAAAGRAAPAERSHYRFQLRVLVGAFAWIALAIALVAVAAAFFSETQGLGGGRMGAWSLFVLPRGHGFLYAAAACVIISACWCAVGSLIGVARLISRPTAPLP